MAKLLDRANVASLALMTWLVLGGDSLGFAYHYLLG
jgi:hypothetical protein